MNQLIVRQIEEFSDSLPASELEHLWLVNTFVRMYLSSVSLMKTEENEAATISNFLHLFTLHVTKKFSFNILKTISLKIEKKTSIEAHSEGEVNATQQIDESESKKDALSEARDFGDSNPVALERTVW